MRKLTFFALFLCLGLNSATAQTLDGSVTGSVRDEQGAVIPGAAVTLRGPDATFEFVSDDNGAFRFLHLQPGAYRVAAALAGFRQAATDVNVVSGHNVELALTLRVGGVSDTVTVTASAPMVDAKATGTATT